MNKGNMRWIDQPNHRMINIGRQPYRLYVKKFFILRKNQIRGRHFWFGAGQFFFGDVNPNCPTYFPAWILKDFYFRNIDSANRWQCWYVFANSIGAKLPSMITTLDRIVFKSTLRERYSAMRAVVAQGKRDSILVAAKNNFFAQHFLAH